MQFPNTVVNSPWRICCHGGSQTEKVCVEAKRRLALYELNAQGDMKPLIISWETFWAPHMPQMRWNVRSSGWSSHVPEMKCWRFPGNLGEETTHQKAGSLEPWYLKAPNWTWTRGQATAQLQGDIIYREGKNCVLKSYLTQWPWGHSHWAGTLHKGHFAWVIHSWPPGEGERSPLWRGLQRWKGGEAKREDRRQAEHRTLHSAHCDGSQACQQLGTSISQTASSVDLCVFCRNRHSLRWH